MRFQPILNTIFSKFSGGACPRTPLEGLKNFFLAAAWLKKFFSGSTLPSPKQKILDRTLDYIFQCLSYLQNFILLKSVEYIKSYRYLSAPCLNSEFRLSRLRRQLIGKHLSIPRSQYHLCTYLIKVRVTMPMTDIILRR